MLSKDLTGQLHSIGTVVCIAANPGSLPRHTLNNLLQVVNRKLTLAHLLLRILCPYYCGPVPWLRHRQPILSDPAKTASSHFPPFHVPFGDRGDRPRDAATTFTSECTCYAMQNEPAVDTRSAPEGAEATTEYDDWCPVTGMLRDLG